MQGMEDVKVIIIVDVVNDNTSGIPAQAQLMYSYKNITF